MSSFLLLLASTISDLNDPNSYENFRKQQLENQTHFEETENQIRRQRPPDSDEGLSKEFESKFPEAARDRPSTSSESKTDESWFSMEKYKRVYACLKLYVGHLYAARFQRDTEVRDCLVSPGAPNCEQAASANLESEVGDLQVSFQNCLEGKLTKMALPPLGLPQRSK